jgi:hypothetical protein
MAAIITSIEKVQKNGYVGFAVIGAGAVPGWS